jgi:hypothetical protein
MKQARNRRQFLKGAVGVLSGALMARITGLFPEAHPALARANREETPVTQPTEVDTGELYEGFLILPEHESIPDFVQPPPKGYPQLCGVGDIQATGLTNYPSSFEEFISSFSLPVITLEDIEQRSTDTFTSYITQYETGEVFFALHQIYYIELDALVSFSMQTNFASPYPVYIFNPVEEGHRAIIPEKVDFLPTPGLAVITENETFLTWIQNDLLYSIHSNRPTNFGQLHALAQSLAVRISN